MTESIVLLERGVCSCAELQVFSYYRGWKEACQATRAISATCRCKLSSIFFFLQGKALKEIHAFLTETLGEHALSYATVNNWVTQFKQDDFSSCVAPRPGWPKTVTTPEIIDQIHKLILEDQRILAKSITEQLGISREQVGSIIHEDLYMQKLSSKWVWTTFGIFSAQSKWFPVTICDHGPNLVISLTWRQSNNQWSGGIVVHPAPKNSKCKNSLEKFLPRFFGIKTAASSLIIFQRAKLSTRSITHLCWCNWRTFWRKTTMGRSPRGSCSFTTMPWPTGHLKPRRNWATWASIVLITLPYSPDLVPADYHLFPGLKNNWKVTIFGPMRRSLLLQRPG